VVCIVAGKEELDEFSLFITVTFEGRYVKRSAAIDTVAVGSPGACLLREEHGTRQRGKELEGRIRTTIQFQD